LRFSIVGSLLASPPAKGDLKNAILELAERTWRHPITDEPHRISASTIERWYYTARREQQDPVAVLRRRIRKDSGKKRAISDRLKAMLLDQHRQHKSWSYRLHADNLAALVKTDPKLGPMPSYATIMRFMKSTGLIKQRRLRAREQKEADRIAARWSEREIRSYEAEYVGGLWHLDFHHGSKKVLTARGEWRTPMMLGILDDRSRLACHGQWYLAESAENLVHGLSQAIQKRGLPRSLMTDNGSAMLATETREGLARLGILHETTLPYSPYQNGKQESFWGQVEGRLVAMLERKSELTLTTLNEATQAWIEMEYNRAVHSETKETPIQRFIAGPTVARESPSSANLKLAFTQETTRTQRKSDGTISIEGTRFEIPLQFRHRDQVSIRYASFDLSHVVLVDQKNGSIIARIYPLDRARNADGKRRSVPCVSTPETTLAPKEDVAPLLKQLITEYGATGLPPAYLPKKEDDRG
jgi:transposase InsO family protein